MFSLQEVTAEGIIRPNWKNVGILMAILAAVGLGIFFLVAILNKGSGITYEELEQQAQVQGVTASVSVVPELRDKISVSFQIKESDLKYGFLTGDGKVKNISSKVIEEMVLTYKVAGDSREYSLPVPFIGMKPGEEKDFYIGQQKLVAGSNSIVFGARITWRAETTVQPPAAQTPSTKEWPIKGTWKIQTASGTLTVIYRETDSAKGKIKFWVDDKTGTLSIQNVSNLSSLQGTSSIRINYLNGTTERKDNPFSLQIQTGETKSGSLASVDLSAVSSVEYWFEIK